MNDKHKSRLAGVAILLLSIGGTVYNWYSAFILNVYWPMVAFAFPLFFCVALTMILFPYSRAEYLQKYGHQQPSWEHIPAAQKWLIFAGVVLGALNSALMSGWL